MATTTLPLAADYDSYKELSIKNRRTSSLDILTVQCAGSDTIDLLGQPNSTDLTPAEGITLVSDGVSQWKVKQFLRPSSIFQEGVLLTPLVVTQTRQWMPETEITILSPGHYMYMLNVEIEVIGILGNQTWDIDLDVWDTIDDVSLLHFDWAGAGEPVANPRTNFAVAAAIDGTATGHPLQLAAVRATATGTVTIQAGIDFTWQQFLGPI